MYRRLKGIIYYTMSALLALSLCQCAYNEALSSLDERPGFNESLQAGQPEVVPDEIDEVLVSKGFNPKPGTIPPIGAEEDEINKVIKEGIPVEVNEHVERWIHFFTKKRPDLFQRYLDRGEAYKPMILSVLRDQGIPSELYYQALIESGFVQSAVSSAQAVGIWQFIKGTGTRYGLQVGRYADERIDPYRATIAASMYLNDLHNVFDSWYLAMAAYNAGEMRIMRAIMKGKTRDFWALAKGNFLPSETMNYIPKFLAATIIGSDPEKYGFRKPEAKALHNPVAVSVPTAVPLRKIASISGIPHRTLYKLNKHLKRKMTPPGSGTYKIWVPEGFENSIAENQVKLEGFKLAIKDSKSPSNQRRFHRVRRGETLTSIARKYNVNVRQLKKMNRLKGNRIYVGNRLRIHSAKDDTYQVKRGDNLHSIARKFGISVYKLKSLNSLRRSTIYAGQILKVSSGRG